MPYETAVVVLSDRASRGAYEDRATPAVRETLGAAYRFVCERVLPDDAAALQAELIDLADRATVSLVITTGGTGLGARDVTPQATAAVIDYEVPGMAEAMRAAFAASVPTSILSRAIVGVRGRTLIVNLPGNPKAVRENLSVIVPVLPHALDLLAGTVSDG